MEITEYNLTLAAIERTYQMQKKQLYYQYGMSTAKFKIGDLIKEPRWALVVDTITVGKSFGLPEPIYHGFELTKNLQPRKDKGRVAIYGNECELVLSAGEKA